MEGQEEDSRSLPLIREYSKLFDNNQEQLEGLPYDSAFELLTGNPDKEPDEREDDERALWQLIVDDEATEEQLSQAEDIISKYPFGNVDQAKEMRDTQRLYAEILDSGVRFDTYDVKFARDLISKIKDGKIVSINQFKYIKYFMYRYRNQVEDILVYEEDAPEWVYEQLDDNIREATQEIIDDCETTYKEVNPR